MSSFQDVIIEVSTSRSSSWRSYELFPNYSAGGKAANTVSRNVLVETDQRDPGAFAVKDDASFKLVRRERCMPSSMQSELVSEPDRVANAHPG
jgi:hypothetical protein